MSPARCGLIRVIDYTVLFFFAQSLFIISLMWYSTETRAGYEPIDQPAPPTGVMAQRAKTKDVDQALHDEITGTRVGVATLDARLVAMELRFSDLTVEFRELSKIVREQRENRLTRMETDMDNIKWWMRAMAGGLITLLCGVAWGRYRNMAVNGREKRRSSED